MSFTVLPCTPSILPTCCAIQWQACASNPFFSLLYPNGGTEALQKDITYHLRLDYEWPDVHMFCVVDTSDQDKPIAFAQWTVRNFLQPADTDGKNISSPATGSEAAGRTETVDQNPSTAEEGMEGTKENAIPPATPSSTAPPVPDPNDTNPRLFNHYQSSIAPLRSAYQTPGVVMLDDLSVTPSHQWRGAGKVLLKRLTDFADKRNLACYIEATPVAYDMYIHQGFREVGRLDIDLVEWREGEGVYKIAVLVRDARGIDGLVEGL
ncbi:MAG: hypothetical protein Q9168_003330 [Polycauliona sp. 1 TL-2023]